MPRNWNCLNWGNLLPKGNPHVWKRLIWLWEGKCKLKHPLQIIKDLQSIWNKVAMVSSPVTRYKRWRSFFFKTTDNNFLIFYTVSPISFITFGKYLWLSVIKMKITLFEFLKIDYQCKISYFLTKNELKWSLYYRFSWFPNILPMVGTAWVPWVLQRDYYLTFWELIQKCFRSLGCWNNLIHFPQGFEKSF